MEWRGIYIVTGTATDNRVTRYVGNVVNQHEPITEILLLLDQKILKIEPEMAEL